MYRQDYKQQFWSHDENLRRDPNEKICWNRPDGATGVEWELLTSKWKLRLKQKTKKTCTTIFFVVSIITITVTITVSSHWYTCHMPSKTTYHILSVLKKKKRITFVFDTKSCHRSNSDLVILEIIKCEFVEYRTSDPSFFLKMFIIQ